MAVKIGKLETICEFTKEEIKELKEGQDCILKKLQEIREQVTVNKTKLTIFATLAGLLGGVAAVVVKILIT